MPRKFSQGSMAYLALASLLAFNSAEADPVTYEWSTTSGVLFSADPVALEIITGQTPFHIGGGTFIVFGSGSGTFTYDSNVPAPDPLGGGLWLFSGPSTAWSASLFGDAGLLGTFTGDVGVATFRNADESSAAGDLLNVQCCGSTGSGYSIGPYTATGSGVIWTGGQFLVGQTLPLTLPPPDGSNLQIAGFSFFNPDAPIEQRNVFIGALGLEIARSTRSIAINIKPGGDRNSINPRSKGKIPLAILTTNIADGDSSNFDAMQVDPSTVAFGPNGAAQSHRRGHVADIDGDGDADLILHFNTQETGIQCGDIEATLTGETFSDQLINGSDTIDTVGCPKAIYDFTQTFGNIEVSGTLTYRGEVPASITVEDLNAHATWDLSFRTIEPVPGPFPLEPFTLSDSNSSWEAGLLDGTTLQIDVSATEIVFDLTTPPGTNAIVALMSDDPANFSQFAFSQTNQPGGFGTEIFIQAIMDPVTEQFPLPFDAPLSFPVVSTESAPQARHLGPVRSGPAGIGFARRKKP